MANEIAVAVLHHVKQLELENAALRAVLDTLRQETTLDWRAMVNQILSTPSFEQIVREQFEGIEHSIADISDFHTAASALVLGLYNQRFS